MGSRGMCYGDYYRGSRSHWDYYRGPCPGTLAVRGSACSIWRVRVYN